jgi:hypothetical protein
VTKFKTKYEALNFLNGKYDVYFCEITCYQEAKEFWNDFVSLWRMDKVDEQDMTLGEIAMDRF